MNNRMFISGKITGDEHYREKFDEAVNEVELPSFGLEHTPVDYAMERGSIIFFKAVNPCGFVILGRTMERWPWAVCMAYCLWRLTWCSWVYQLGDWKESRGARIEHWWATVLGKRIVYQIEN